MNIMEDQVGGLARVRDEDLRGRASGAGARTLLESIMTAEQVHEPVVRPRRVRRFVVAAVAASALAAAVVIGPGLLSEGPGLATSYANAAMEIERRGDQWVAKVKDPYADHAKYAEAFKAVGLDVTLTLLPSSPSGVGKVVRIGGSGDRTPGKGLGGGLEPEGCQMGTLGCGLAVTVDVGYTGKGVIYLGRTAQPGERYGNWAPATREGETLHGLKVDERTVGEVRKEAAERGIKTVVAVIDPNEGGGYGYNPHKQPDSVGDDWIVWEAEALSADAVRLLVTKERLAKNPVYDGPKPADLS
ncbi:hypothetical protein GCM10010404_06420 [Nonomuraea africana]|uniref:Uncharacterized protein n=1 Tax=Nonomuraea africana TaxID=46171 RepID=A0ABR9KKR7_9ACTN|nr:hypothetical protein [Nonomuraea africana]MBE1562613.1 hypothetical protein [Nonomuraea africana]